MTRTIVVFSLFLVGLVSSRVAAQDGIAFTLADVETTSEPTEERAVDTKQVIVQALGELHWGMSKAELIKLLTAQIRAELEPKIKLERDIMRQDALYLEARERARRLSENFVSFDGPKNGWDVSPVAGEFTRGNREGMLVVTGKGQRDLYFFIQGKLWKWYRELTPAALGADDSAAALQMLSERFGPGSAQRERRDEAQGLYEGTTWADDTTRVTALRRGDDTCLVFEDLRTLEKLATLRYNVQANAGRRTASAVVDLILLTDAERKAREQ